MSEAPTRAPFHTHVFTKLQVVAAELFRETPELEGLALIPSWNPEQMHVPFGVIAGRNGPLQTPREAMHMANQLWGALDHQCRSLGAILSAFDAEALRMAEEIKTKTQELHELNAKLATARVALGSPVAGATPAPK